MLSKRFLMFLKSTFFKKKTPVCIGVCLFGTTMIVVLRLNKNTKNIHRHF